MAARRHPTAPVDALDRRIDWTDVSARATAGLTRWVLGAGLLTLHAFAFVVVGLGMLLWNILTDPSDITVGEPLLRWGIVLALHAASVLIGWAIVRVVRPPAARPAYRPIPRTALRPGRPEPVTAEPVWYPNGSMNGHPNGASPNGSANGHIPYPAGAWPARDQTRTVVTSQRVTTMVVATARDGFASARRRYRRDRQTPPPNGAYPSPNGPYPAQPNGTYPAQPNGANPAQPNGAYPAQPWAGAAPAPNGSPPPANGVDPSMVDRAHAPDQRPTTSWSAAVTRDEVISVTQVGPKPGSVSGERPAGEEQGTDPVRSWLDGYLDGKGREREARWTWVEAAAATWLARGEETQRALPAPAAPISAEAERPASHAPDPPPGNDAAPTTGDEPNPPPPSPPRKADGPDAAPA